MNYRNHEDLMGVVNCFKCAVSCLYNVAILLRIKIKGY